MERWRAEDWRVELAIAVIVAVVSATGAWVGDPAASGRTGAFPASVALFAGLVLVARRVTPIVVLGVVLALLVVASVDGHPVLCRQGRVVVSAFHPELTGDLRLHEQFLQLAEMA